MVTFGLNGEPGELTELPGVTGLARLHVLLGAPGWPVVGFCGVSPARAVAPVARVRAMTQNALAVTFLMSLPMSTSVWVNLPPPSPLVTGECYGRARPQMKRITASMPR